MIELKITGNDAREVFVNTAQMFMLLAQGGNALFAQTPTSGQLQSEAAVAAKVVEGEVIPPPKAEKSKRQRPGIEVSPLPAGGDPIPDFLDRSKTPTLEECRARTKAVIKKFEDDTYAALKIERKDATQPQIDEVMTKTMAFMMSVFKPFNIKKAPDLKPDQFVAFMADTAKYL